MVHHRQRLPLRLEPGDDLLGVHAQLDHLEGHFAADRLLLFGHIDHAAAAFADLLQQLVAPQRLAHGFVGRVGEIQLDGSFRRRHRSAVARQFIRPVMRSQQGHQTGAQRRIAVTGAVEEDGALGDGPFEGGGK